MAKAKTTKSKKAVKKPATRKPVARSKKSIKIEDFRISRESSPFMTFKITQQTFYWLMLLLLIFALALWVLTIQIQTMDIINSIETLV